MSNAAITKFEKKLAAFLGGEEKTPRKAANGRTRRMLEEILTGPPPLKCVPEVVKP